MTTKKNRSEISEEVNILLTLYKHNCDQGRHHQNLRERSTNIIMVIIGAVIGFIFYDKNLDSFDFFPSLFLAFLGFFGAIWSRKYHERYAYYTHRGSVYRDKLSELFPDLKILKLKKKADLESSQNYRILSKIKLNYLWILAHLILGIAGLGLAIYIKYTF